MEGLLFLIFFAVYAVISIVVIFLIAKLARKLGRSPWVWGLLTTFIMYNLVFWAWIPSVVLQDHYCKTQAGFWLYKTPDKWKAENPNEIFNYEQLPSHSGNGENNDFYIWHLNQRIDWVNRQEVLWPSIRRYEKTLVDIKTKEVLAKEIYFQCGSCGGGGMGLQHIFTPQRCECAASERKRNGGFSDVMNKYTNIIGAK
jgi:energy-coupling factor transporter transmembrane protein EcfT